MSLVSHALPQHICFTASPARLTAECRAQSGKIGSALACEFKAVQLFRPRDEKRQIGEQHISNITVFLEGFLKQTKDAFMQLLRTLLAPLLQSIVTVKLFLQRFSGFFLIFILQFH